MGGTDTATEGGSRNWSGEGERESGGPGGTPREKAADLLGGGVIGNKGRNNLCPKRQRTVFQSAAAGSQNSPILSRRGRDFQRMIEELCTTASDFLDVHE